MPILSDIILGMKIKIASIMAVFAILSCSTLPERAIEFKNGSTQDSVKEEFGSPAQFKRVSDADEIWSYYDAHDACYFMFHNGFLSLSECKVIEKRMSTGRAIFGGIAAGLKGFSDGYNASRERQVSCQSYQSGNMVQTNCQ